jgi:hypothetical protein
MSIGCKARADGEVEVAVLDEQNESKYSMTMPAQDIGTLVSGLLLAAKESSDAVNRQFAESANLKGVVGLAPSKIALTEVADQKIALIVHMGLARIGFLLSLQRAQSLGQALIAAGATRDKPQ